MRPTLALLLPVLISASVLADTKALQESRRLQGEARKAYGEKDYALFLEKIRAASDLRPDHPTLLYFLSAALTLNGSHDAALDVLERVAAMGMVYSPEKEPDFAPLASSPRFRQLVETFACHASPMGTENVAASIDEEGLIPEGVARDARKNVFFVSSVRRGTLWRVAPGKESTTLVDSYPLALMGLAFDPRRNLIWAAAAGVPQREGISAENRGRSKLVGVDAASGRIVHELDAPGPGPHLLGDVAISARGVVVATDSRTNELYREHNGALRVFSSGPYASLQGVAWTPRGDAIYAADYSLGIFHVDPATGDARLLTPPRDTTLLGVDGIYMAGNSTMIAVQNGVNPNRVIRISLDRKRAIRKVETLAANLPSMNEPALATVDAGRFFFIANGHWGVVDEEGVPREGVKAEPAKILELNLRAPVPVCAPK